jgi:DNA/RNA endonuclease G (NUC1)
MKRLLLTAVAAILAVVGCQKAPEVIDHLEFTSERPAVADTRTGWTGETIEWTAGDAISMAYAVDGNWVGPNLYSSTPLSQDGPTAHFTVPGNFQPGSTGVHEFYALYPALSGTDFSEAPDVFLSLPEIQTPSATSFDPKADLLAGVSAQQYRSFPTQAVPLRWTRLVAHGDITLKSLPLAPGENIRNIVLLAQSDAELTGDIVIDLACPEDFATDGVPRVTVLPDNLSVDASGNLRFWISIFPETITELTVLIETDKASYRKHFTGISKTFTQNARNILGVNMADAEKTTKDQVYVKVTSTPSDWTGDYLIVNETAGLLLDGDGSEAAKTTVKITDGTIPYETYKAYNVRIDKDGSAYTMKLGEKYLGLDKSANALNSKSSVDGNKYRWTFSVNGGDTEAKNVEYPTRTLRYNQSAKMFRCYTSGQEPVQFYKLNGEAGGGGGTTPETPTVTTEGSSSVTQTEATLSATYTGTPTYGGFEWGLSEDDLEEDWQAAYLNNGSFQVTVNGLGAGHTYYYRAYIAVMENGTYKYYYGEVKSFTTPTGEIIIGGDQPGWYETPAMNITHSGSYMYNTSDPTQYYAIHMCSGDEKGPGGKTARSYTVCYSAEYHCPVWVAAPRHAMYVGSAGRNDSYRRDPDIPADIQYSSTSTGGGCNKGHMLGSAERTSTKATNRDVFYYPNIAPQLSANFNTGGGRWNVLEDYVDTQVCADTLYEVLGCYFERYTDAYGQTQTPSTITFGGRNDVSMPTMFYYVLLRTKSGNSGKALKNCSADELQCVAFVRSHVNVRQAVTSRELMSVADLERITGVTYFPNVPNAPKNSFKASDWGL